MPPRKSTRTPKSSPAKPSAKAKGKRKAADDAAPSPSPTKRRARLAAQAGDSDQSDADDAFRDDEEPTTFVTASAGDAYMLYSTQTTKTSDSLLSTAIDPAFTLASYAAALRKFDAAPNEGFQAHRDASKARTERAKGKFARWLWELDQGFNLLLTGLGSKRTMLNSFAERARSRGNVVVVNGYDTAVAMVDLVTALEDLVRLHGGRHAADEDEEDEELATPRKRKRGAAAAATPSKAKGKGKAAPGQAAGAYKAARPVSALESRVRRLCASIRAEASANAGFKPIYLVLHSLDGPSLRLPKHISLLALLAAQPHIHLVASIDHARAPLLFPTALATARPPTADASSSSEAADLHLTFRAFTFLYHDVSTLVPYDVEVSAQGTLSHLLPPSVFPPLSASLDPTASSLAQSATHVLASVTDRARRLFNMLGQEQVRMAESLPREVERAMRLTGAGEGEKAPVVAMTLHSLKEKATDALIATHPDQVDGFLSEFKDHGVVRASRAAPDIVEGVNDDEEDAAEEGGEWVWIPLAREALEEVLEELGIDE
ncbi:Origin recognition complex subunit 2 [Rhodotorula kratochvilovae]